jgi:DNA-directed RNA polymerase, mitochondrial
MRYKDSIEQQLLLKTAANLGRIELLYAGLDILGSTPWRINEKIFHVVLSVWNAGYRLGKLPPVELETQEPEKPLNPNQEELSKYKERLKTYLTDKANNHSDRCNVNYKIEIARAVCYFISSCSFLS